MQLNQFDAKYQLEDFPKSNSKDKEDIEFWNTLESKAFRNSALFVLLNTIRMADPITLTDAMCRTQLSKLYAMMNLIDFKDILVENQNDKSVKQRDELPEDQKYED